MELLLVCNAEELVGVAAAAAVVLDTVTLAWLAAEIVVLMAPTVGMLVAVYTVVGLVPVKLKLKVKETESRLDVSVVFGTGLAWTSGCEMPRPTSGTAHASLCQEGFAPAAAVAKRAAHTTRETFILRAAADPTLVTD